MDIYKIKSYMEDVHAVCELDLPWEKLANKKILLSGSTGMIGSFFIDVILEKNRSCGLNARVYAIGRDKQKAISRFSGRLNKHDLIFIEQNVTEQIQISEDVDIDYCLHLASNTHPLQYSNDPIGTITTNIIGTRNMLEVATKKEVDRFVFASSNEIYGENRGDVELFGEDYCGYINCNTLRAGYPESKRCGESLCQAYRKQKGLEIVIPRFTRTYGPTMQETDTKAISQFIKKGVTGENIVLKSEGKQYYSYQYVADSVSGLLYILLLGEDGEAYNIAASSSDITLRDLAKLIARICDCGVVFEIPDKNEAAGYSTATKARLDGTELTRLGWKSRFSLEVGLKRTIDALRERKAFSK